jgi:hypothetical protein
MRGRCAVGRGRGVVVGHRGTIVRGNWGSKCSSRGDGQCACNKDADDCLFHHKAPILLIRRARGCLGFRNSYALKKTTTPRIGASLLVGCDFIFFETSMSET